MDIPPTTPTRLDGPAALGVAEKQRCLRRAMSFNSNWYAKNAACANEYLFLIFVSLQSSSYTHVHTFQ